MDVNIVVPNTSSDLSINYDLVSVVGDDPNALFSNSGSVIAPAGQTSYMGPGNNTGIAYTYLGLISLDLADLSGATLSGPMVFDVVLTGTSSSEITAGLAGETFKVSQRVVIVSAASLAGTYSVSEPSISLGTIFNESYQVELSYDAANPLQLTADNSAGFDSYFFAGTTMTLGNGGITAVDGAAGPGIVVALADYFAWDVADVMFGEDESGNSTITFGANTGQLVLNALDYSLVLTKM